MKNLIYALFIIVLCACNNKKTDTQVITATPTGLQGLQKSTPVATTNPNEKSNLIFNPEHGQPGHTCDLAVGAPLNKTAIANPSQTPIQPQAITAPVATVANTGKNLNPAHGQPNHRCDIAVGEPLDSKPSQAAKVTQTPIVAQAALPKTGKGLNPAHGQPNHRCDIAVGESLSSKPVQKAAIINSTPNKTLEVSDGAKLNPKHGEPNHRCDIAVGAPLT